MSFAGRRSAFIHSARVSFLLSRSGRDVRWKISFSKSQFLIVEERRSALRSPEDSLGTAPMERALALSLSLSRSLSLSAFVVLTRCSMSQLGRSYTHMHADI
ncbi:hypothetical protein QQF64_015439 [Cirrhinus molitorella]|uniref:Uncharacterized protein n=1 Tax=Cirrhinus molitorella TaxID=172907 RepID=A0ABR3NV98_9TELE